MTKYDRIALDKKKHITGDVSIISPAPPDFYNRLFKDVRHHFSTMMTHIFYSISI